MTLYDNDIQMFVPCPKCSWLIENVWLACGEMSFSGGNSIQCPNCSAAVLMPDSHSSGGTVEVINTGQFISQFRNLQPIVIKELHRIIHQNTPEVAIEKIKQDERFTTIHKWIPRNKQKFINWITMIASLITIFESLFGTELPANVYKLFQEYNTSASHNPQEIPSPTLPEIFHHSKHNTVTNTLHQKEKKIGRNDLCPCGSGRKFKKCCLN